MCLYGSESLEPSQISSSGDHRFSEGTQGRVCELLSQGRNHCYRYAYLYLESVFLQADCLVKMASVTEMGNSRLECVGYNILLCTLWGSTPLEKLLGIRGWF